MSIKVINKSKKGLPYSQCHYRFYHSGGGENDDNIAATELEEKVDMVPTTDIAVANISSSDVPHFSRRQKGNYVISGFKPGLYARAFPYPGHEGLVRMRIECDNDATTWVEIILNQYDIRNMKQMAFDFLEEDMITEMRIKIDKLKREILAYRNKESEVVNPTVSNNIISGSSA